MKQVWLLMHFLGLLVGAGTGFAVFLIGQLAGRFDASYRRDVLVALFPLRYISYLGLLLLIFSGGMMIQPFVPGLAENSWLIVKLALVAVLVVLSIIGAYQMHRIRSYTENGRFKLLALAGKLSMVTSLVVVMCAVYAFN